MRGLIVSAFFTVLLLLLPSRLISQEAHSSSPSTDSDLDGLSDQLEQSLLERFTPTFMIDLKECSNLPAEFSSGLSSPTASVENGTIYGQVFPTKLADDKRQLAEIHFYHLWKQDCGAHGHPLDAEHVSVLVQRAALSNGSVAWEAKYWYAAAHEDTVCDVSQITRASTIRAEDHGATIWISADKHASFLNPELCQRGCGSDRCAQTKPLNISQIVNLGEIEKPMNGTVWTSSAQWPLEKKMTQSDFPPASLARLESLPETDIAWFNPGRHPAQGMIAISDMTSQKIGNGGDSAAAAMSTATDSTNNALNQSYRKTVNAIGTSARRVKKVFRPK